MANMTTVLTEAISQSAGSRTYTFSGNTYEKPSKVVQKSSPAGSVGTVADDRIRVIVGTADDNGLPMQAVNSFEVIVRRPSGGQTSDLTTALDVFRDIVASDEFGATVNSQSPLA
jgi:hypothetical protein